ncbi:hypothetical protein PPYR_04403 [Photinus pyralis]|uniref:CWH43-like N-terminal domain-containing protein n=1 Tax=Photinus pyralis TaxID=7054 RepID=A0A5N4AY00_PHOPY|nr:hypothetical protein PPYR_04403 [Photinus pyralis]
MRDFVLIKTPIKTYNCPRYLISVYHEHVYPILPYISETGSSPPESCIFGQMVNFGAVLLGVIMYIRYRQVDFVLTAGSIALKRTWNEMSFWCGNLICFGVTLVGNFQQTNASWMHFGGAFLTFGGTAVLFIIQTRIGFALRRFYIRFPRYGVGNKMMYFRVFLTIFYNTLFIMMCVCAVISVDHFTGLDYKLWTNEHGGYSIHLASTLSEWLLVLVLMLYVLTVSKEFKSLEYQEIKFLNKNVDRNCIECC